MDASSDEGEPAGRFCETLGFPLSFKSDVFVSSRQIMNRYMDAVGLDIIKNKKSKLTNPQIFCILNKYCNNFGTVSSTPVCSIVDITESFV